MLDYTFIIGVRINYFKFPISVNKRFFHILSLKIYVESIIHIAR